MSEDYTNKVQEKRQAIGVSPLGENGLAQDNSSLHYCETVVYTLKKNC